MSLLRKLILVPLFFLIFLLSSEDSFAKIYQGVDQNGNPAYFEYDPATGASDCSDFLEVTSSSLEACQLEVGNYQNTCCTNPSGCTAADNTSINQWDYNYASGCKAAQQRDFTCGFEFVYQTQTCPATDTCRAEPYLYPGLCTQSGCAISGTRYKTCCNANGTVDGNCSGGDYTGTCTSSYHVVCGVSSCSGVSGNCTTLSCGAAACAQFAQITPTPTPTPTPPPGGACPTSGGWGGSCSSLGATKPEACPFDNTCNTCSLASCVEKEPGVLCWLNTGQCYNDPNFCKGFGNCGGGVCTPGETRIRCSDPNACILP